MKKKKINTWINILRVLQIFSFQKVVRMWKRLLFRCIHHFKSRLIDSMDRMRISGTTKPSSVILRQKKSSFKSRKCWPEKAITSWAKRDGVINPQNYNLNHLYWKFWCSQNATNQPTSTVELGYMWPGGLTGQPAVTLATKKGPHPGNKKKTTITRRAVQKCIISPRQCRSSHIHVKTIGI